MTATILPPGLAPAPASSPDPAPASARRATPRRFVMCRPDHFAVSYSINPWMDPRVPVCTTTAVAQWEVLRTRYLAAGHTVDVVPSVPGLPDLVFAANGLLSLPGGAYGSRFAFPERALEADVYADFVTAAGFGPVHAASYTSEGEGDYLVVGSRVLAGTGFRTDVASHRELAALSGLEVVTVELVDSRFYHLDTALAVLDEDTVAYFPGAFSASSRRVLEALYPDAVLATETDAAVLGLNAVSDGHHVFLADRATELAQQLRERGFDPVGVDLSELLKGGGSVKCCTLEIRS